MSPRQTWTIKRIQELRAANGPEFTRCALEIIDWLMGRLGTMGHELASEIDSHNHEHNRGRRS